METFDKNTRFVNRSFKYRLRLNKTQSKQIDQIIDFLTFLYNCALEERKSYYKRFKKSLSYVDQCKYLPEIVAMFPEETSKIFSQALQQTLKQVDRAYKNFFDRLKKKSKKAGFPRFKSKYRNPVSICFPQIDKKLSRMRGLMLIGDKLIISKIGKCHIVKHRPLLGDAKQARIVRKAGRYFISFSCENVPAKKFTSAEGKIFAFDIGIDNIIIDSDGNKIPNLKPGKTSKEVLAEANRKRALKRKGSNNFRKASLRVQRIEAKITNQREDFQHKLVNKIINENDVVIFEDLNIKSMMESEDSEVNNNNVSDAAWGGIDKKFSYKVENTDKKIIKVNPYNTSKECSQCQNIKDDLTLADRMYKCDSCGLCLDRDVNAAINIKKKGLKIYGSERTMHPKNSSLDKSGISLNKTSKKSVSELTEAHDFSHG